MSGNWFNKSLRNTGGFFAKAWGTIPRKGQVSLMAIGLGITISGILILLTGNNPFEAFWNLFRGGLMSPRRIGNTLANASNLALTGLAVAFAFRTGLFNIGASGQMLIGGLLATVIGHSMESLALPKGVMLPILLLSALAGGALWGYISGLLKARFNVHEVVSTIMLNFIALWTAYHTIQWGFTGGQETQSRTLPENASLRLDGLTELTDGSALNLGFLYAIGALILIYIIVNKTTTGFQLKATGFNREAAKYAGMNVNRNVINSMVISGALAGMAGLTFYTGYGLNFQIGLLPSQGFDGIAVALLGANTAIGVALSAVFFGILQIGKGFMQATSGVPNEIGDIIIGLILYGAATSVLFERLLDWNKRRKLNQAKVGSPVADPQQADPGASASKRVKKISHSQGED
jgi:ABC-type uncharacterized transport system permease subunit